MAGSRSRVWLERLPSWTRRCSSCKQMGFFVDQLTGGAACSGGSWAPGARAAGGCIVGGSPARRWRLAIDRLVGDGRASLALRLGITPGPPALRHHRAGSKHHGGRNGSAEGMPPGTCFTHSQSVLPWCIGGALEASGTPSPDRVRRNYGHQQLGGQCGAIGATCRAILRKTSSRGELTRPRLTSRADLAHNGAHEAQAAHTRRQSLRHYHYFELATIAGARRASLPKS